MNDNEGIVCVIGIIGAVTVVIAICIAYCTVKAARLNAKEVELALQNGYEQKFDTQHTQSPNYQWVKTKGN